MTICDECGCAVPAGVDTYRAIVYGHILDVCRGCFKREFGGVPNDEIGEDE